MSAALKRTIILDAEQAGYVDSLVASGAYAGASEVMVAGLQALKDRDGHIERWLLREVAPVYDAMVADPSRGVPLEDVIATIESLHSERVKSRAR